MSATVRLTVNLSGREITADVDTELQPEDIFEACNRIRHLEADLGELPHEWQRTLRRKLETTRCPSMSAGDFYELELQGRTVRTYCHPFGWGASMHSEAVTR